MNEKTRKRVSIIVAATVFLCSVVHSLPLYCGYSPDTLPPAPSDITNATFIRKQVVMVIRHGDRMVASPGLCWQGDSVRWNCNLTYTSFPNNTPRESSEAPPKRLYRTRFYDRSENGTCLVGQLTSKGLQQQIDNGMMLNNYLVNSGFLSKTIDTQQVFIRSDWEERTVQSAQGLILGLYPVNNQSATTELIDIFIRNSDDDDMAPNPTLCPKLDYYKTKFMESDNFREKYINQLLPLFKKVSAVVGYTVTLQNLFHIYDCIYVHVCHDKPIPFDKELMYEIIAANDWISWGQYNYPNATAVGQVGIGFLVGNMLKQMELAASGIEDYKKFVLYSGHDTTLASMCAAFEVWDGFWPPYASHLFFELYENTQQKQLYVRGLKSNKEMIFSGCNSGNGLCRWQEFRKIASNLVLTDPETECNNFSM